MKITIEASSMQKETIAQHALGLCELVMFPGERTWMIEQARKQVPGCKITAAHLIVEEGQWLLTVENGQ